MAISRAQMLKELLPGLNALFGDEYTGYDDEHSAIYETENSDRSFEEEVKLSGFDAAPVKNEGSAISYDTAQETYTARYNHETIAMCFSITEEAMEDNLYVSLSGRYTKALARAMAYTKQSAGGEFFRINKVLLKIMKERGVYNDEEVLKIAKAKSVQKVDWLNEHEKKVFRTAFEIPVEWIIRLASQRQKYIDQAQSINLYFTSNDSEEYIGEMHKMAFEDEGILSLYYIYSMRGADGVIRDLEDCPSCSG